MREDRFIDQVVIITGGGTGIGKACALAFAEEGANVIIAGRRGIPLRETVEEIRSNKGEADYEVTDISKSDQVTRLVDEAVRRFGKLDILLANAAVILDHRIEETTDEDVHRLIDINVKGTYFQLRDAIRVMKKQGFGNIVVVSSGSGSIGHPFMSLYCTSKAAVQNMVRALALELATSNIRVNAINPGLIDTPMPRGRAALTSDPGKTFQGYVDQEPVNRAGMPSEMARVILFLASDEASFVTGSIWGADGGFLAGK